MSIDKLKEIESLLDSSTSSIVILENFLYVCQSALLNEHQDCNWSVSGSLVIAREQLNTLKDRLLLAKEYTKSEKIKQVCQSIEGGSENV